MKKNLITLAVTVTVGIFVAGCGNEAPKMSSSEKALFETSTPEIKQLFEKALAADSANNYLSACTNYQALLHQSLTMDQGMAMQTAMKSLKLRIFDAAAKGDAGAKTTLDYMNADNSRRGR